MKVTCHSIKTTVFINHSYFFSLSSWLTLGCKSGNKTSRRHHLLPEASRSPFPVGLLLISCFHLVDPTIYTQNEVSVVMSAGKHSAWEGEIWWLLIDSRSLYRLIKFQREFSPESFVGKRSSRRNLVSRMVALDNEETLKTQGCQLGNIALE